MEDEYLPLLSPYLRKDIGDLLEKFPAEVRRLPDYELDELLSGFIRAYKEYPIKDDLREGIIHGATIVVEEYKHRHTTGTSPLDKR